MNISKQFAAVDEVLDDLQLLAEEFLDQCGATMKESMQLSVALEELFVNVAHYAYNMPEGSCEHPELQGKLLFSMDWNEETHVLTVCFTDAGTAFDPTARPDPDVTLSAEERKVGGLGIYLARKAVDTMTYQRLDGLNILTLKRKLGGSN